MKIYQEQEKNVFKTWVLMAGFLAMIVLIGYFLSWYYNDSFILYFAVFLSLIMNFTSYWFSDKIALSLSGAKKADEKEYLELHRLVENLAITAGLPKPRVYIIQEEAPNAFATGRNKKHSAVAVTTGLLKILERNELEGVIAHELAHIGNRDILLQSVVVVLVGLISIISDIFIRSSFRGGDDNRGKNGALAIIGIILMILSPIIATIIQLSISRKREFLADATGALLTRYPEGLASALEKISFYGKPMNRANNATAHLFISNPFGSKAVKGLSKLFLTHPPVEERVQALLGKKAEGV